MHKNEYQGGKIKPSGFAAVYTDEQKWELYKCTVDPIYFITKYCWIISTEGRMLFELYEYQKRLVKHYVAHKKTITLLSRQAGKALALDTPIMTPNGFKAMGDLVVGDQVIGEDGKPTTITFATDPMYDHKCYRVRFDTDEIIADAEHVWVVSYENKTEKLTTEQLIPLVEKIHAPDQAVYIPAYKGDQKNTRHYIQEIELVESVPVRCIRVDNESHLFCAGTSLIPTHNTESAAAFLLWWAIFRPDQKVLIASYKADAAKAIMKRLKIMYEELPWWIKPGVKLPGGWNIMSVEFDNGSQIIAETTTGNTGRGYSINLFYLDEFAYVHPNIADEFWTSIFPTISSSDSCRCIITSTANTDEDKFAQIWFNSIQSKYSYDTSLTKRVRAEDLVEAEYETLFETPESKKDVEDLDALDHTIHGFYGFHAPWTEKPGRDDNFRLNVLASGYTETEWKRDFECQFLTRNETLISPAKLLALNAFVRPPRFVDRWACRWYEEIKPGASYGVILDPSEGVERDDACIQVWEFPSMLQVAEWNSNQADQPEQSKMLYRIIRRIYKIQQNDPDHNGRSNIYYSVECNGIGLGILNALEIEYEYRIPGYLVDSETNKMRGIRMTAPIKKNRALDLAALIERNIFLPRSRYLVSQLKNFVRKREGVYQAKEGSKDDLVMSCILMMQMVEELRVQVDDIQERLMMDVTETFDTSSEEALYGSNNKPFVIIG